ncbi:MAG: hypothetical protein ACOX81_00460 [Candidatus Heteroscillospira sp.]|jgi:hypothetical protein
MLEKRGLCKVLKSTYARGYEYVPEGRMVTINGRSWAVQCDARDVPVEASVQIVENVGYMPTDPMLVQKGEPNQMIMPDAAKIRMDFFKDESGEMVTMKKIPVIYRDRWQLYQTERGAVYGFDTEIMRIIDFKAAEPATYMAASGAMGIWSCHGVAVYIAPGRFSWEDSQKIHHIAALDWENQLANEDPVANMSLFDGDDDVALLGAEE